MLIAAYFDVAVEYLEGTSDTKKPSKPQWQDYNEFMEEQRLDEQWRYEDFIATMGRIYKQLNFTGQEYLLQTASDMLQIERFRKDTASRKKEAM